MLSQLELKDKVKQKFGKLVKEFGNSTRSLNLGRIQKEDFKDKIL